MLKLISRARQVTPTIILVAMIFLAFVGFFPVALVGIDESLVGTQNSDGDPLRQLGFTACFVTIAFYLVLFRDKKALLAVPLPLVILLIWCWLSLFWAISPEIAIRRLVLTTMAILTIAYCVKCMSFGATIRVLCSFFAVVLIADWISVAFFKFAIHQQSEIEFDLAGDWRGLHNHKNEAGSFCAIAVIMFFYETRRARSLFTGPILIALSFGFLYMSRAKTSVGFVFVAMLIGACATWGYRKTTLIAILASVFGIAALSVFGLLPQTWDRLTVILDDPASFTGRSQIWPVMIHYSADHPLLGSGYGSFWSTGPSSPIFEYGAGWIQKVFQAHDGYLDILVQIGSIGLIIVLAGLIAWPIFLLFMRPLGGDASRWLLMSVLSFGWLRDTLESSLADRANPTWLIMVIMYCLLFKSTVQPPPCRPHSLHSASMGGYLKHGLSAGK